MTEQEMRIAIAEACGWKRKGYKMWTNPADLSWEYASGLPDYLNDLNAMHEAEKVLDQNQKNRYLNILHEICLPEDYDELDDDFGWCTATARQRAEAFMETLNLWIE